MRNHTRPRPNSQHGAQPFTQPAGAPTRKIFNCIVDDTALVAGVKKSTRNGIRQWVKNGQIRLFVPLHALEQLSKQKNSTNRHGEDVQETLQWLDDATNKHPEAVTLQGGDQYFSNWNEVERFAVPRTLFSENDHVDADAESEANGLPEETASKLTITEEERKSPISSAASIMSGSASPSSLQSMRSSVSQVSPPTSPTKAVSSPVKPIAKFNRAVEPVTSSSAMVPMKLQSLFNYILWRIHQELDPAAALESFIFLCNDPNKVHYAKGFDIRSKRLEQLRETVGREQRDINNRLNMQTRENQQNAPAVTTTPRALPDDDEEVVYKPLAPRGPAAITPHPAPNVIDPNAFVRTPQVTAQVDQPKMAPQSPRMTSAQPHQARGGQTIPFTPRGNARGTFRGSPRGRGNFVTGRGGFVANNRVAVGVQTAVQPNGQIDPDSFSRPRGSGYTGRGGRRLWVPE
ncbi:hypothetical protein LTR36_002940 [Oleoguttula mirabilis]|uniref:PIN domain-containing protein n=1 Tax=Oleoguttula mirabilis TaxID=1507867 RepID=A0AAV9JK35_9PEZI|nr:hypothetical protein LTR36_002940 [Oleoguttula mirabilis]